MTDFKTKINTRCNHLCNNGYTLKDEGEIYDMCLKDVIKNVRWYLDNLNFLHEFRVSWNNYRFKTATSPLKFVKICRNSTKKEEDL